MIDEVDATDRFNGRSIRLTLSDRKGFEADQLDIAVDDHAQNVALPRRGAKVNVAIGWVGGPLVDKGLFVVDEIEHNGPPDRLTIRARSVDFRESFKTQQTRGWHDTTLGALVTTLAKAHQLIPAISPALAAIAIPHMDQTNESDGNLLTRLGRQYDAIATIKSGRLLFTAQGTGATVSGRRIERRRIQRSDGDRHRYSEADRSGKYTGVTANYYDADQAELIGVTAGDAATAKTLRETYPTRAEAADAADAEWRRIQRAGSQMQITLARGDALLAPETPVSLNGWKREITEKPWITGNVTHSIGEGGFVTSVELELENANA
nr:contractile injection system protein, VgrG/Pvc8 family [Sedimenticola hydrogenitrophicus]